MPKERSPLPATLTAVCAPPMHSLAASSRAPPIPPRRPPAPRCTITRSPPRGPLTLAPEPRIRGAFFLHALPDHPNSTRPGRFGRNACPGTADRGSNSAEIASGPRGDLIGNLWIRGKGAGSAKAGAVGSRSTVGRWRARMAIWGKIWEEKDGYMEHGSRASIET